MCNQKRPRIAKTVWREKNTAGDPVLSNFNIYYKAIVIKTMYRHKTDINTNGIE